MMFPMKRKHIAFIIGFIAFLLVFLSNWQVNLFRTSMIRGIIAFITFFIIGSIAHFIIFYTSTNTKTNPSKMDLLTNNDFDLNEIYQTSKEESSMPDDQNQESFEPLEFKKVEINRD